MYVLADFLFRHYAVKNYADKGRPHIEKIQAVEAVCNHKHIARENGGVWLRSGQEYYKVGAESADRRVEQGAAKSAQGEVICHKLAWRCENSAKVLEKVPFPRVNDGYGCRDEEEKA